MPSMIGLDRLACQQGFDYSIAYGFAPFRDLWHLVLFCDVMAFGHFDTLDLFGFVPDDYYGLLAILLYTWRHSVTDDVMARGTRYLVLVYPFIQSGQLVQITWVVKSINEIKDVLK